MSVYTEEELADELDHALSSSGLRLRHAPDHAGYYVQIGKFTMTLPYAQAEKPDPALANGWIKLVNEHGETWHKGDLRVSRPMRDILEFRSCQWVFGKSRTLGDAYPISGRCVSRDVAMAAAEALP